MCWNENETMLKSSHTRAGSFTIFKVVVTIGVIGIVILLSWPSRVDEVGPRYLVLHSLSELSHAMHSYHEKHGRFPPAAVYSKDGTPLLSWRILLLPYLEEQADLFRQFKLDEPWDSPHNLLLLPKMPQVYSPIEPLDGNPPLEPCTTLFQVFVGKGTAFEGREGLQLKDFRRSSKTTTVSNTILIVEAGKSVPWTKPEDIPYDENQPLPKFGGFSRRGFLAARVDASILTIAKNVNQAKLRAAILRNSDGPWPWDD
jgi:hypothetical protein